jgi:hypothetical protein
VVLPAAAAGQVLLGAEEEAATGLLGAAQVVGTTV